MKISERMARIDKALEPLKADLLAAGVRFKNTGEIHLLHKEDYPIGLPIIFAHLQMAYDDLPRAIMAEAFYYTKNIHTLNAWPDIAEIYTQTPNQALPFSDGALPVQESDAKEMLANALLRLYQPKRFDAVVDIVRNPRNGRTRIILLEPLLRVRNRRVRAMEVLKELMADPVLETALSERGVG
ncbi:hypothetical protein [Loktanella sp. S4079]|uniref:hypothetical protein n=1 Tax=Loktanella sp. S4079 TaxID=579483 RepID=UPI0005FA088F|nr:hypothetical protein [Loktanella sp. S4079]KJZ20649.1 hypothetical protein TW80_07720 [Loktanella sp. S4079]